jgi:hypothetical protein
MPLRSGIPLTINKYLLWVKVVRSRPLSTSQSTLEVGATHYPMNCHHSVVATVAVANISDCCYSDTHLLPALLEPRNR